MLSGKEGLGGPALSQDGLGGFAVDLCLYSGLALHFYIPAQGCGGAKLRLRARSFDLSDARSPLEARTV